MSEMPSVLADDLANVTVDDSQPFPYLPYNDAARRSQDKHVPKAWPQQQSPLHNNYETTPPRTPTDSENENSLGGDASGSNCGMYADPGLNSVPNGRSSGSWVENRPVRNQSNVSINGTIRGSFENGRRSPGPTSALSKVVTNDRHSLVSGNGSIVYSQGSATATHSINGDIEHPKRAAPSTASFSTPTSAPLSPPSSSEIAPSGARNSSIHRFSAPEYPGKTIAQAGPSSAFGAAGPPQLVKRHTLQVPKPGPSARSSVDDSAITTGRFSPTVVGSMRRGSMSINRRNTQSIHSNMPHDDISSQDEDANRWAEAIRQKRASKRRRRDDEDDDRVVVGTKVDQNHVNYVTAYNMLTGIRFTVSRTNAKMDRELTDADFTARHKFSFDITGNELTPSAKYDFKFKDYAPWVFRALRAKFKLDPADYLMSLTSKYILSELGSPGKSGSFFYFSRDYKYIIKTIHHAEHKLLRKILKDYYNHVEENPNTLLSQFYGLHRVKIPYGRKIHFVVMNNLFPPHRDIHQTFDLKGSTIGRDFHEEDLAKNPRATLKDLNWLRRNKHLEFGPDKKSVFLGQMERDVKLLQKLKIMDYSMLVGIHDLSKGNEENLRDKTLQVFQPHGEESDELGPPNPSLLRTPSKLESARKAHEMRKMIKQEKPIPIGQTTSRMPDMLEENTARRDFIFYSDDGGFRATHESNAPGDEIYYLGIIDLLTHYGTVKRLEHFWKSLSHEKMQLSPIPPVPYGDRFIKFVRGITKSPEEAARDAELAQNQLGHTESARFPHEHELQRSGTDLIMAEAEHEAHKAELRGQDEHRVPDRIIKPVPARSSSTERDGARPQMTLPIVEEAGENSSTGGRSGVSGNEADADRPPPTPPKDAQDGHLSPIGKLLQPPQVPPKERDSASLKGRQSFDSNKALPMLPKSRENVNGADSPPGTAL